MEAYALVSTAPVCVNYRVSEDPDMNGIVTHGKVYTSSDIDYTLKVYYLVYSLPNQCGTNVKSGRGHRSQAIHPLLLPVQCLQLHKLLAHWQDKDHSSSGRQDIRRVSCRLLLLKLPFVLATSSATMTSALTNHVSLRLLQRLWQPRTKAIRRLRSPSR